MAGPIRAIIVDDEPLARRGLEMRLRAFKDFEIVAQCANGREAVEAVAAHAPDLMFLDIEMPGIDGFEVLRRVPQTSMPMVVFVTAFDRYAIDAFDAHALDYLLKPLVDERLERTLEHVREQFAQRNSVKHREQLVALLARVTGAGELDAEELIARGDGRACRAGSRRSCRSASAARRCGCRSRPSNGWMPRATTCACTRKGARTSCARR